MNLLHIFESERPGSAQPYSKLDREERHLAAILFHLLQNPANLKAVLSQVGCSGTGWNINEDEFGIYFEYSYPRDLWNSLGHSDAANRVKRQIIIEMLQTCQATHELLRRIASFRVSEMNQFFVGPNNHPHDLQKAADLSRHIQSPANWRLLSFGRFLDDHDVIATCMLKWSFRVKPDLVIHTDNSHAVCIELKLASGEGQLPTDPKEKALLKERGLFGEGGSFKFPIKQTALQRFLMTELLGLQCQFLFISTANDNLNREIKNDISRIHWHDLLQAFDTTSLPRYMQNTLERAGGLLMHQTEQCKHIIEN
jgi:hypothetical protein